MICGHDSLSIPNPGEDCKKKRQVLFRITPMPPLKSEKCGIRRKVLPKNNGPLNSFKEITMNTEAEMLTPGTEQAATPSADFINAISRFLDTDPDDLLVELGYYAGDEELVAGKQ